MSQATNTPEDIKPFTVRFPAELVKRLAHVAVEKGVTKSAIVQEAVEGWLTRAEIELDFTGGKKRGKRN